MTKMSSEKNYCPSILWKYFFGAISNEIEQGTISSEVFVKSAQILAKWPESIQEARENIFHLKVSFFIFMSYGSLIRYGLSSDL